MCSQTFFFLFELSTSFLLPNINFIGSGCGTIYRVAQKNVPNIRMALCDRVVKMNQQKSTYVMSKHLRICLGILT